MMMCCLDVVVLVQRAQGLLGSKCLVAKQGQRSSQQQLFCGGRGGREGGKRMMSEGTSSRSHERRARGGGEASLMKRTLCPRPLFDAQTHARTCLWACVVLNGTLVIVPALLRGVVDGIGR